MRGMKQVELLARLQTRGTDISIPALSLLEGQKRPVTDIELAALSDVLGVSVDWLLRKNRIKSNRDCVCSPCFCVFLSFTARIYGYISRRGT